MRKNVLFLIYYQINSQINTDRSSWNNVRRFGSSIVKFMRCEYSTKLFESLFALLFTMFTKRDWTWNANAIHIRSIKKRIWTCIRISGIMRSTTICCIYVSHNWNKKWLRFDEFIRSVATTTNGTRTCKMSHHRYDSNGSKNVANINIRKIVDRDFVYRQSSLRKSRWHTRRRIMINVSMITLSIEIGTHTYRFVVNIIKQYIFIDFSFTDYYCNISVNKFISKCVLWMLLISDDNWFHIFCSY